MNNLFIHFDIDALSFYIYDARYVTANSIARQPFGTGKLDRGQSFLFHKFIQSWVGYELVKVLVTFDLQPITLNSSLKKWSKDLHDIFRYMRSKNPDLKDRAEELLDVLFTKTLHSGYWSRVQFRARTQFFERSIGILSVVVPTWLRQLPQFFLNDKHGCNNGDWNNLGKFNRVTTNPMKDTTPLADINFSAAAKSNVLTQITNVDQFKPKEDITGVCTSLEEWTLCILKLNQAVQLQELVDADSETERRIKRVQEEILQEFKITTTNFTSDTNDVETENDNLAKLDTNTK
jgi:hypothetical protein